MTVTKVFTLNETTFYVSWRLYNRNRISRVSDFRRRGLQPIKHPGEHASSSSLWATRDGDGHRSRWEIRSFSHNLQSISTSLLECLVPWMSRGTEDTPLCLILAQTWIRSNSDPDMKLLHRFLEEEPLFTSSHTPGGVSFHVTRDWEVLPRGGVDNSYG